jgi:CRP-like cAMP-binding protein
MPVDTETLKSLDLFADLEHRELEQIAPLIHPVRITEGEEIMRRGDKAHSFHIILSGNFMVEFEEGRAMTLHSQGDIMGWSTVVTPFRYRGTAIALTAGEVLTMAGRDFLQLIQSNSALSDKLMKKINTVVAERKPLFSAMSDAKPGKKPK